MLPVRIGCTFAVGFVPALGHSPRAVSRPGGGAARAAGFVPALGHGPRAFSRPGGSAARAAGFTLLEILVVLVLIAAGSLLAVGAFNGGGMRGAKLHAAAREVAAQLRFTRAVAISSGQPQEFRIDPRARSWSAAKGRHGSLTSTGELVFVGAHELQQADTEGVVRFFPDGAATGGRVRFLANGAGWDVDVAWLTGEVRVQRARESR